MKKRTLPYIISIALIIIFLKMLIDVLNNGPITNLDTLLNTKLQLLWNPLLNNIMIFITRIADTIPLIILSVILLAILIYKKRLYHSLLLASALIIGEIFKQTIKFLIQRARPENALIHAEGFSFPSGHATTAIIFFSLLIYFFKDNIKNKLLKNLFIAANITLILLIGFSRIYLGVHWLSDVIAVFCLGLFLVIFLSLISDRLGNLYKEKKLTFS